MITLKEEINIAYVEMLLKRKDPYYAALLGFVTEEMEDE